MSILRTRVRLSILRQKQDRAQRFRRARPVTTEVPNELEVRDQKRVARFILENYGMHAR